MQKGQKGGKVRGERIFEWGKGEEKEGLEYSKSGIYKTYGVSQMRY